MIRRRGRLAAVAVSLATFAPGAVVDAGASPLPPAGLTVEGGEDAWHAVNSFRLEWQNPATAPGPAVAAVHYTVRDPLGAVVDGARLGWAATLIHDLRVPGPPGAYTAEVWLEDAAGDQGPAAAAKLRFDDTRPGPAAPRPTDDWIGRAGFPHTVRIERPRGEPPVSGIRGYAVSFDRSPQGEPCAGWSHCTDSETDLRGGIADDSIAVAELPEGTNYVHVVAVSGSGVRSATPGHATLRVDRTDPVTRLSGAPSGWTSRPVVLTATASDSGSGMTGSAGSFTAIRVNAGAPTVASGDSVQATVIAEGAHGVAYYARDAAGNVDDGATGNGLANRPPATAIVRIDRAPPSVAFLHSEDPRDPELIEARVVDSLSGPSPSRGSVGVRRVGSGDRFEALPTESDRGRLRARWDSEAYPAGEYEFRATGYDAAGNAESAGRRSDGTRMVLRNPLKAPTALSAGFGGERLVWHSCVRSRGRRSCRRKAVSAFGKRPARRVVPYGRGVRFSGRLTTVLGTPLQGAPVQIVERIGRGPGGVERVSIVRTGAGGTFSIRLPAGPSREIAALFGGTRTLAGSAARRVRLGVRGEVRMAVSSTTARVGGRPVVFSGRVVAAAGTIPADGRSIALQFRLPGLAWAEFRTIRTDRRGRFRYAYRFADDDSRGARFQFRAYAPAQSGWPYEPGGSRPVAVRGR